MRAVVISGPGEPALVEVPTPELGPDEVLIRSRAAGICGSDVDLLQGARPEGYYRYPVIPGHEWAGEVASVGERVTGLAPGDKVIAEGFLYCGSCPSCRAGLTNLCEAGYDELGFTRPGGFAEYVAVPARLVHRLPDDASLEEAALLEPTAVVAHAFLRATPRPGDAVVVVGSREGRMALGRRLGATHTIHHHEDVGAMVSSLTGGRGADLVVETAGRSEAMSQAVALARHVGTVVLEGIVGGEAAPNLSGDAIVLKHLAVYGIFGASSEAWEYAVQLFTAGLLDLGALVSHRFDLADYQLALDRVEARAPGTLKVLITHEGGID